MPQITHTICLARQPTPEAILADPCSSYFLQRALRECLQRDPVNALRDAEVLTIVLRDRYAAEFAAE